jgi:SulP family sulfate permease
VSIFRIHGPFLFGATDKIDVVYVRLSDLPRIVILRLRNMTAIDATGIQALEALADRIRDSGRVLIVCGAREQPALRMRQAGFDHSIGEENFCVSVSAALDRARKIESALHEARPDVV